MIAKSELIINADGSAFHLHIKPDQLADDVLLVGDPGRVGMVSSYFDTIEAEGQSREFRFATGIYKGKRMTCLSHGIGPDNIDIVMTELDALANIDFDTREIKPDHRRLTLVRMGTCGAIQPDIPLGSAILSHVSIGFDCLMRWYANLDKINLNDYEDDFLRFMDWDAAGLPRPYFVKASQRLIDQFSDWTVKGMTISAPGFYGPQGRVLRLNLAMPDMLEKLEKWRYDGRRITNFEMESSALAGMSAQLGHDAITVCCAIANRYAGESNTDYTPFVRKMVEASLDTLAKYQ
ncbi:MAG: nucleoside phosphorylase [Bacteroidales bacterium]|nr:nucleoside phosphorylase [Bacteroidales bacterium]